MMTELSNNIFDIIIIVLLLATIFYAAKLSRMAATFKRIEKDKENMELMVGKLAEVIDKANEAIANMKETASTDGTKLQADIDKAKDMADELEIIIASGNNLVKRIQNLKTGNHANDTGEKNSLSKEMIMDAIKASKRY